MAQRCVAFLLYHECFVFGPWVGIKGVEDGILVCEGADPLNGLGRERHDVSKGENVLLAVQIEIQEYMFTCI
jgi:hypothetical protein